MNKIELLKAEIEQKKFECSEHSLRFVSYAVLIIIIQLTGNFNKPLSYFFLIILLFVTGISLIEMFSLRREINEKYDKLFKLFKNKQDKQL